jgi:hypothetical protein
VKTPHILLIQLNILATRGAGQRRWRKELSQELPGQPEKQVTSSKSSGFFLERGPDPANPPGRTHVEKTPERGPDCQREQLR